MKSPKHPEPKPGMLAFMPWATIKNRITIGNWELIPVKLADLTDSEKEIKRILSCYKLHAGCGIHKATLIKKTDKDLLSVLDENDRLDCFSLGEIISFSSLSTREFFSHTSYTNADSQKVVIQSFVENSGGFSIVSRRRDGNNTNYVPDEYHLVIKDDHISSGDFSFDEGLVTAILSAQNLDYWPNIYESIFNYLRSNTDDNTIQIQSELMFAMGAFERLLDVNNGQCTDSAQRFTLAMSSVMNEEPKSGHEERSYGKLNKYPSIREIWIRDFCACRGDLAHGRTKQAYPSIWNPSEHLLLASEIFPILMKIKLSEFSLYNLSNDDLRRIFYFDRRLRIANLFRTNSDEFDPKFGWEEVRRKAVWEWEFLRKKLVAT